MSFSVLLTCDDGSRRRGGCVELGCECKGHPAFEGWSFSNKVEANGDGAEDAAVLCNKPIKQRRSESEQR